MDNPAQNPTQNPVDPNNPIPPQGPADLPGQPSPYPPLGNQTDSVPAPQEPTSYPPYPPQAPTDIPTPPQETIPPQNDETPPPQNPLPPIPPQTPDQTQQPSPGSTYQPMTWSSASPEYPPQTQTQPPEEQYNAPESAPQAPFPPPPPTTSSSPIKGLVIGGLLALIVVAAVLGVVTFLNKSGEDQIKPPPPLQTAQPGNPVVTAVPAKLTPPPTATVAATPKTEEVYINNTYKYKFFYPLGLNPPAPLAPDAARFPKALEVVKLTLSNDPAASVSSYVAVWASVNDVPKYITDGQSQFVKVNIYTTNRFTVKKPSNIEETHYLTQKYNNVYDIMLETASGKISDPAFEKILNSFSFLDELPSTGISTQPSTPASTKTPTPTTRSTTRPSPTIGL